jgi:putative phage-type endonuclease
VNGPEFHAERNTGIGGSDAPALLGLSRYGSPWSVWARLVGLIPANDDEMGQRQRIGHELEGAIGNLFHHETGLWVIGEQSAVRHPEHTWLRGFIDGYVTESADSDVAAALGGFEAKTDGRFGWDDVPPNYRAQAQHYMMVTGLERWWFGVLFAGFRFQVFELKADVEEQAVIFAAASELWNEHVMTGVPPLADGSEATADALARAYPEHIPGVEVALDDLALVLVQRDRLKDEMKVAAAQVAECDNAIKARMADAEVGTIEGVPTLTYRSSERAGYTVPPATIRTLRNAAKPKERQPK